MELTKLQTTPSPTTTSPQKWWDRRDTASTLKQFELSLDQLNPYVQDRLCQRNPNDLFDHLTNLKNDSLPVAVFIQASTLFIGEPGAKEDPLAMKLIAEQLLPQLTLTIRRLRNESRKIPTNIKTLRSVLASLADVIPKVPAKNFIAHHQLRFDIDTNVHVSNPNSCNRCVAGYPTPHQGCQYAGHLHAEARFNLDAGFREVYLRQECNLCGHSSDTNIDWTSTSLIQIWQLNEVEWYAGRSLDEITGSLKLSGRLETEAIDPDYFHQLTLEETQRMKVSNVDKPPVVLTYQEYLENLIREGQTFPCLFAERE